MSDNLLCRWHAAAIGCWNVDASPGSRLPTKKTAKMAVAAVIIVGDATATVTARERLHCSSFPNKHKRCSCKDGDIIDIHKIMPHDAGEAHPAVF